MKEYPKPGSRPRVRPWQVLLAILVALFGITSQHVDVRVVGWISALLSVILVVQYLSQRMKG